MKVDRFRFRRFRGVPAVVAGVLALALVAGACSSNTSGDDGDDGGGGLTGSITISGSSTVEPISSLVAEIFNEQNPDVSIQVDGPGTGDGFELFCEGETDISDASRPIDEDEVAACKKQGIEYVELEVGLDGITVMASPTNPVECLNSGDLYALFGPESKGIDTWNGADSLAKEVGGNGGFPDLPLEITAPGEESGTYDAFIELSGIDGIGEERGLDEEAAAALRSGYQSSANDNVIIQAMEGSEGALGFVGFAFADTAGEGVKKLQIDGGDGCVGPDATTIADGSYPLSRSLYIYVNVDKAASNEALAAFVDSYVSESGLSDLVTQVDYIALPQDRQEATRTAWQDAVG